MILFGASILLGQAFPRIQTEMHYLCVGTTFVFSVAFESVERIKTHSKINNLFSIGVGALAWFIGAECCAQQYRSYIQALVQIVNSAFICTYMLVSMPLYDLFGPYVILALFNCPSLIAMGYLWRCLPETKGRDVAEVVAILMK